MKKSFLPNEWKQALSRRPRSLVLVYGVLRVLVTALLLLSLLRGQSRNAALCLLSLVLFLLPEALARILNLALPAVLETVILLFIFSAEILGELGDFYVRFPRWDMLLHSVCGFLSAAVGFSMIDLLNRNSRVQSGLTPLFCAAAAFCFSMTVGVFWEFFEFFMDLVFHTNMQKDTLLGPGLDIGLYDTMEDLLVNAAGAAVFSLLGYCRSKQQMLCRFAEQWIPIFRSLPDE